MPLLQVKDFPEEVYERLRACAKEENRSISQQTVTIIKDFLANRDEERQSTPTSEPRTRSLYSHTIDPEEAARRLERRRKVLEEIHSCPVIEPPDDFENWADFVRADRDEREAHLSALLDPDCPDRMGTVLRKEDNEMPDNNGKEGIAQ